MQPNPESEAKIDPMIDFAEAIHNNVNLLTLKRTSRLLLMLDAEPLEEFIHKYSGVMIFLVSIYDHATTAQLLSKVSRAAARYLIEEELRLLLIREIGHSSPEKLPGIAALLDSIDESSTYGYIGDLAVDIDITLEWLSSRLAHSDGEGRFGYLTGAEIELGPLVRSILQRNPNVVLAMIPFAADELAVVLIEMLLLVRPDLLRQLPESILRQHLKVDVENLKERQLIDYLPERLAEHYRDLALLLNRFESRLIELHELHGQATVDSCKERKREIRQRTLEVAAELSANTDEPLLRREIFHDFLRRSWLSQSDCHLLETVLASDALPSLGIRQRRSRPSGSH